MDSQLLIVLILTKHLSASSCRDMPVSLSQSLIFFRSSSMCLSSKNLEVEQVKSTYNLKK